MPHSRISNGLGRGIGFHGGQRSSSASELGGRWLGAGGRLPRLPCRSVNIGDGRNDGGVDNAVQHFRGCSRSKVVIFVRRCRWRMFETENVSLGANPPQRRQGTGLSSSAPRAPPARLPNFQRPLFSRRVQVFNVQEATFVVPSRTDPTIPASTQLGSRFETISFHLHCGSGGQQR